MRRLFIVLTAVFLGSTLLVSRAEDTNALKTDLGVFENQTGTVIIKGFGQIGSISVGAGVISVRCKESTDPRTGRKAQGLAVDITGGDQSRKERLWIMTRLIPCWMASTI